MFIIEITYKVVECFLICWRFFVKKIGKIKINHANMSNKYEWETCTPNIIWLHKWNNLIMCNTVSKLFKNFKSDEF